MARGFSAAKLGALALCILLSACAGDGFLTWEPETPAERELRERAEALQATQGEGGLVGAALGAVIGVAAGGAQGAFAGAQVGRLGGAASGAYVRELQSDFAEEEDVLEQVAQDVAETNAELEETIAVMREVLEERRAALAALRASVDAGAAETAQLERQEERTRTRIADMELAIEGAETRASFFGEARNLVIADTSATTPATESVDGELSSLADRIAAMRSITDQLSQEI